MTRPTSHRGWVDLTPRLHESMGQGRMRAGVHSPETIGKIRVVSDVVKQPCVIVKHTRSKDVLFNPCPTGGGGG